MKNNQETRKYIWLVLFAVMTLFAGTRMNFPLAAWLAPVFAIRFYRDSQKGGRAFLLLWLAMAVPTIIAWKGATAMGLFLHPIAEPIFFVLMTPLTLIPYAIDRLYFRRWAEDGASPFWLTLVYPISYTALDFFSASGSPFGTFGAAAYSQAGFTAFMQVTSVLGIWGLPILIGWFASVVNYVWENDFQWARIKVGVTTFGVILLVVLVFGFGRMALSAPAQNEVQVGGFSLADNALVSIMSQLAESDEATAREAMTEMHAELMDKARSMAEAGAQIVVLQEAAGIGYSEEIDALLANAGQLAQEEGIYLVLPTATLDPAGEEPFHNVVRIIDPSGEIVLEHYKYGGSQFEGSAPGSGELQTVETPYGKLSAIICWDADFPATVKQAGIEGVDLLFVPANDWREVRDIHANMAIFRAVENGVPIFRQTGAGVSFVSDAFGRLINRVDSFDDESSNQWSNEQMVIVPAGSVDTLYPRIGDIFGTVMQIVLIGLVIFAVIKRKRK